MADIIKRLFEPPRGSYFLFGPRGSGKSTWLRELHPRTHWIDLLDEAKYQTYLVDPAWRALHPLVPEELGTSFRLDEALGTGLLPVIHPAVDRQDALDAYVPGRGSDPQSPGSSFLTGGRSERTVAALGIGRAGTRGRRLRTLCATFFTYDASRSATSTSQPRTWRSATMLSSVFR